MSKQLAAECRAIADAYEQRALYTSEWRKPLDMLRRAAHALEMAEVDRSCFQAALRAEQEMRSATEDAAK